MQMWIQEISLQATAPWPRGYFSFSESLPATDESLACLKITKTHRHQLSTTLPNFAMPWTTPFDILPHLTEGDSRKPAAHATSSSGS